MTGVEFQASLTGIFRTKCRNTNQTSILTMLIYLQCKCGGTLRIVDENEHLCAKPPVQKKVWRGTGDTHLCVRA